MEECRYWVALFKKGGESAGIDRELAATIGLTLRARSTGKWSRTIRRGLSCYAIAARIEGIAEPGGISISEDAWRQVQGKVVANFVDAGEQSPKNIARPVRVYRVKIDGEDTIHPSATAPSVPDKPSIAVLPFENMSGDP